MCFGKFLQALTAHHGSIVIHQLGDCSHGLCANKARHYNTSFGVAPASTQQLWVRRERKYMTRTRKVIHRGIFRCQHIDRVRALLSTNASRQSI